MIVYRANIDGCILLTPDWSHPTDERASGGPSAGHCSGAGLQSRLGVALDCRNRWGEWPPGEPGREVTPLPPTDEARDEVEASIKAYRRERRAKREAKG